MIVRVLVYLVVFAAMLIGPAPAQSPALTPLHVGMQSNADMVSLLYAQKSGMFAKAGLDVQVDFSASNGAAIAAAVSAGSYDIGRGSILALFDAHLRGLPFTLIGAGALYESAKPYAGLLVSKGSPFHSATDLANAGVIGVVLLHDFGHLAIIKAVEDAGGKASDLRFAELPMYGLMVALDAHRVIAAEAGNPFMGAALDTGRFRLIPIYDAFGSSYSFSYWFTTKDFAAKHAAAIRAFTRVMAESARYTNVHQAETAPLLSQFSHIPLDTLMHMVWVTNGSSVDPKEIQLLIDTSAKYGFIAQRFPAQDIIDPDV